MSHPLFNRTHALLPALILSTSMMCSGQSAAKTYWSLSALKKADGTPMRGATLAYMENAAALNPYFTQEGDQLFFDFPVQKQVPVNRFSSFTGDRFGERARMEGLEGALMDSVTNINEAGGKLTISFMYHATLDKDKQFVAVYKSVTEDKYRRRLEDDRRKAAVEKAAIDGFVTAYRAAGSWKKGAAPGREKEVSLSGQHDDIRLFMPGGYDAMPSGDVIAEKFGAIQVGSFVDNDVYNIADHTSGETVATCFIAPAKGREFNMQDYISQATFHVIEQNGNGLYAIEPVYDPGTKTVTIEEHILFLHFTKGDFHIFLLATTDDPKAAARIRRLFQQTRIK